MQEETTSGDIATVDNKLGATRRHRRLEKGKKCKDHKRLNCSVCNDGFDDFDDYED